MVNALNSIFMTSIFNDDIFCSFNHEDYEGPEGVF